MGYCSLSDLFEVKDSLTIAKWIKLNIPDILNQVKYDEIYNKLTQDEKTVFEYCYVFNSNNEYQIKLDLNNDFKIALINIFVKLYGSNILTSTIDEITAKINSYLITGGYNLEKFANNRNVLDMLKNVCKYLTLYTLLINSGAVEVESDKQFIAMCKQILTDLERIAKGELKLPISTNKKVKIKTQKKIIENWEHYYC